MLTFFLSFITQDRYGIKLLSIIVFLDSLNIILNYFLMNLSKVFVPNSFRKDEISKEDKIIA